MTEAVTSLKTLPIADACELMRQAAIGLQHAHEKRSGYVATNKRPPRTTLIPDACRREIQANWPKR